VTSAGGKKHTDKKDDALRHHDLAGEAMLPQYQDGFNPGEEEKEKTSQLLGTEIKKIIKGTFQENWPALRRKNRQVKGKQCVNVRTEDGETGANFLQPKEGEYAGHERIPEPGKEGGEPFSDR